MKPNPGNFQVQKLLRRLRQSLKRSKIVDLGVFSEHSIEAIESLKLGSSTSALLRLPTTCGVTMPAFRLDGENCHPFVSILRRLPPIDNADFSCDVAQLSGAMAEFYEQYQPENALALLGISDISSSNLQSFPAYASVLPWDHATPEQEARAKIKSVREENVGAGADIGIEDGWAWSGPVSAQKLSVEATRLLGVFRSIQKNGYQRSNGADGDISASLLIGNDMRIVWQSRVGQHRAMSLAALNYEEIPVRVTRIVKRDNVETWANVVNGVFSKAQALAVFDRHFS